MYRNENGKSQICPQNVAENPSVPSPLKVVFSTRHKSIGGNNKH